MANMKIKTEKILSPSNIKRIIMLGISIRDQLSNMELGLISDYDNTKTYTRGQAVYYNNYLYKCLYTATGDFDESKWQLIGDALELIEKSDIETMLGLTTDELQTLSSIILDSEVRLDKTWSSSKIYTDLQQCLSDSKKFTLDQFAKANKASYQVITNLSSATDKSIIYLMANGSNYDMYIVESDGTPTKIGDTTIDLSQFYTKTEIDNDFVKKTDADGKYATITTVDGKVDKTSILSTISSSPSDDKLLSEKAINDTLVKKTDITDTIDSTSTSNDIASAKGVYDKVGKYKIYHGTDLGITNSTTLPEMVQLMPDYSILYVDWNPDLMTSNSKWFAEDIGYGVLEIVRNTQGFIRLELTFLKRKFFFEGNINDVTSNIMFLTRTCTTSVADVGVTNIAPSDTTTFVNFTGNSKCNYCVKNGICYVTLWGVKITKPNEVTPDTILPKCGVARVGAHLSGPSEAEVRSLVCVTEEGKLYFYTKPDAIDMFLYGSFSYPVA